jgi:hypothetical protein
MANPTYQSGFYAPGRGTAKYPELWDGCVGAWNPGLGNTGLSLRDWSGNQNNGTLTNGPTWGVSDGRQAVSLTGASSQWVDAGASLPCQLQTFSAAFWVNPGTQVDVSYNGLLGYGRNGWQISHQRSNNTIVFAKSWIAATSQAAITVTQNIWTHITITCRDVSGTKTVVFYKNGVLVSISTPFVQNFTFGETTSQLAIGREAGPTGPQDTFFTGYLDDVLVYKRALSPNEIRTLAQRPGIAYERAPRKFYSLPSAASSRQYRLFRPSILRGA